jgi:hypothetical protein
MQHQEMFDKIAAGIIKQGKPATRTDSDGFTYCVYNNGDGLRCAIGQLLEGKALEVAADVLGNLQLLGSALKINKVLPEFLNEENRSFLHKLQRAHDSAERSMRNEGTPFLDSWRVHMRIVAVEHNLDQSALDASSS